MAAQPELYPAEGVNAVIYAGVAGLPAAFHTVVGGIDYSVDFQRRYVASPYGQPGVGGRRRKRGGVTMPIFE